MKARTSSSRLATASLLLIPLLCGLAACSGSSDAQAPAADPAARAEEEAIAVRVTPAAVEAISSLYTTSATLRADRRATVIARTRGVIRELKVEEGDLVQADQAMAVLENDEQRIAAARAKTVQETTQRDVERLADLLEQGLVSEDEYESTRREAEDARHAFELAELELSRTIIRAPFRGVVLTRHLDMGATVADGTAVYDLADLDPLYADITIPERHVNQLTPGQRVELEADATGESVGAVIERIAPLVDTSTGTVKVTVAVAEKSSLRPGAFVRVGIITDTHDEALVVPRSALVAEGRRWQLYRLADDGSTVHQVEVRLGFENGDRVEISGVVGDAAPIAAGDRIVSTGAAALSDGATVQVVENESTAAAETTAADA